MIGIDTNVLVRYFTQDNPAQATLARRFMEKTISSDEPAHVSLVALAELVWVLRTRYGVERAEVMTTVETLLSDPRFNVQDEGAVWLALDEYELENVEFTDALIAAINREHGCRHTVTFDKRAARAEGMVLLQ